MATPSQVHPHVSRGLLLRAFLGALLAVLTVVPAAGAARGDRGVFVSKGVGRQIFIGGGGVAYGTVFSGGSLVVVDYSASHDMKVDSPVVPTTNTDGSRTYVPAGGTQRVAFRISGSLYKVTVAGSGTFNAAGVFGRLQTKGKGALSVNGQRLRWNLPPIKLGKVPKDVKDLFRLAASGQPPPPALPAPPPPPPEPITTTI